MINVRDIAYVRYQVPDLDAQADFMADFGVRLYRRDPAALYLASYGGGYPVYIAEQGPERALGMGFVADSRADLERVAAAFGVEVVANEELGRGDVVTLTDPDGFRVDLLHGGEVAEPATTRAPLLLNNALNRTRRGSTNRAPAGASHVMRLGHVVLKTVDFPAMMDFYQKVLGFKVSDSYFGGAPENTVAAFLHCGLGEAYTDHHTVALLNLGNTAPEFDHSAFEVLDWDDLVRGNQFLEQQQRKHSWGIGRHVQGSQVFDYWKDPFGNKVEHWTDGDLVNDLSPVTHEPLAPDALAQWAPPMAPDFLD